VRRALTLLWLASCASAPGGGECDGVLSVALAKTSDRVAFHRQGCQSDRDCVQVPVQLTCFKGCAAAVPQSQASTLMDELQSLDSTICGDSSCSVTQGCFTTYPRCRLGACFDAEAPSDAGLPADAGTRDGG